MITEEGLPIPGATPRSGDPGPIPVHFGSAIFAWALPFALTGLTVAFDRAMPPELRARTPFLLFYLAIALTSFLAGVGPAFAATILTGMFAIFFELAPSPVNWIALTLIGPVIALGFAHVRNYRDIGRAAALELARLKFIGDHATDWIFLLSDSGIVQYANRTACANLGWRESELLGRSLEIVLPQREGPGLRDLLRAAISGTVPPVEVTFEQRNKSTVVSELSFTAVRTGKDWVVHVAARDVTERRQIEERLREMRLWESMGVMAGGIAHEFNNLLMSVIGNAELAKESLPKGHHAAEMLDDVVAAGERSAELVRMMLATSGHRPRESEEVDPAHVLTWILSTHSLPEKVRLVKTVEPGVFIGDRRSLETLLWGLISNAAESYGPDGGEVSLTIRYGAPPYMSGASFEEGQIHEGLCLGIIVEDTGGGISDDVLKRAFDPFFTTKFAGRGLGLPAVRGIVRAYSGMLRLKTAEQNGTRVEAWLPVRPA
jgi:two-component system cell cycle sensor histidine kinase/response regulator CckA